MSFFKCVAGPCFQDTMNTFLETNSTFAPENQLENDLLPFWGAQKAHFQGPFLSYPSQKQTYPIPAGTFEDDFLFPKVPSKIEWDLTNGPLSKLLELLDTQV